MARPRQTARKCAIQTPAMYHYEFDNEVVQHPPRPRPQPRRPVSTARKSAPWSGAQYHYPSDDEEQQQRAPPLRHEQPHQHPRPLQQPLILNRKRSRDSEHHSEDDDEPNMDLSLGKRSLQSLSDVEDELSSTKAENRALRAHIADSLAVDHNNMALIEENNSIHASTADLRHINEENNGLRAQIDELHTFIQTSGVLLNAPLSIRRRIDARGIAAAAATAAPVRADKTPVIIDLT
ncbi:hypothetical protein LTR27_009244 [Elasticomyces elasticus]|nr:hypothetical protein LTR27_009244 [Elasticomyces elasticus]